MGTGAYGKNQSDDCKSAEKQPRVRLLEFRVAMSFEPCAEIVRLLVRKSSFEYSSNHVRLWSGLRFE